MQKSREALRLHASGLSTRKIATSLGVGQERVDGLDRSNLTFLQLLQRVIEGFERARHLQPDQSTVDPVQKIAHDRAPSAARRWLLIATKN